MHQARERMIRIATRILRSGHPLPIDLETKLLSVGVDVLELERNVTS